MKLIHTYSLTFLVFILCLGQSRGQVNDTTFVSYTTSAAGIAFHWKDDKGHIFRSIQNLKRYIESKQKELLFAMNAGMYTTEYSPLGLYIENGKVHSPLNTRSGSGNFHLKPNGVFYITQTNKAVVCKTEEFKDNGSIKFATQSGPMLIIDGEFHPAFKKGSANLNIRNGVGILPDNRVVFVISRQPVNFYDFAAYFKELGCKNALYLDGFVSRAYIPDKKWQQLGGDFGVIISVSK